MNLLYLLGAVKKSSQLAYLELSVYINGSIQVLLQNAGGESMVSGESSEKPLRILHVLFLPAPRDAWCVAGGNCLSGKIIKRGETAVRSPTDPKFYYHEACFRDLVRRAGKDPNTHIIKEMPGWPPSLN